MNNMVEVEFMGKKYLVNSGFIHKENVVENNYLNLINHMTDWYLLEPKAVGAMSIVYNDNDPRKTKIIS